MLMYDCLQPDMRPKLSDLVADYVLDRKSPEHNPVIKEGDEFRLRYDTIEFDFNARWRKLRVTLVYMGNPVHSYEVNVLVDNDGDNVTRLVGLQGSVPVHLNRPGDSDA